MNEQMLSNSGGSGKSRDVGTDSADRTVTWRDYVRIFYRSRWVMLFTFLIILLASAAITFSIKPIYEAGVRLMLIDQSSMGQSLFDFTSMMTKETLINNQVEILKSRTLGEHVLQDLQKSIHTQDLELLQPDTAARKISLSRLFSKNGNKKSPDHLFDQKVQQLRDNLSVRHLRNTDMVEVKYRAHSPFEAYYVANAIAAAYVRINQQESQAEVRQVKDFLEQQLSTYKQELQGSEEDLKAYQEKAKVVALDNETSELVRKISEFETMYNSAKTDLEAAKQRLVYIDSELVKQNTNFDIEAISKTTALEEFSKKIAEKQSQLAVYKAQTIQKGLSEITHQHTLREVENLQNQIDALKAQFKKDVTAAAANQFVDPAQISNSLFSSKIEVETEIQSLQPKVEVFGKILDRYNQEMESLPAKKLQLARLTRSAQVAEKLYVMLQEKYQESRITEVGQMGNVRIIDSAKEPEEPIVPKKKLNLLLGLLLGLGFALAAAFVIEYMDDSVRTMADLSEMQMPLIATIPFIKPDSGNGFIAKMTKLDDPEVNAINERLVTHLKPKSPVSEAYRALRTNILFTAPDNPKKTILVTSTGPQEGKSTSVANLAITFAQAGTKTLLIDADLRRPMLHKLFQVDKQPGLTNALVSREALEDLTTPVAAVPDLSLLTCGVNPPNPAELLGSARMKEVLDEARQIYDMILIDTPPVIAVTDPSVLARFVDGVVVVVKTASTQRSAAMMAAEQLRRVGAPVLGVLLNGITTANFYGSFYYQKYYYYYTNDGEKKCGRKKRRTSA